MENYNKLEEALNNPKTSEDAKEAIRKYLESEKARHDELTRELERILRR